MLTALKKCVTTMKATANNETAVLEYPRPQLRRKNWQSLDGWWEFSIDKEGHFRQPEGLSWDSKILVPFSPETSKSGIHDTGYYKSCWYKRTFHVEISDPRQRVLMHFGAADYFTTVWINGHYAGSHQGGYTPFCFDITAHLDGELDEQTVIVRTYDDPMDLQKPRGKQDWQLNPHSIWYPRTTGIWQSVWLEVVHSTRIDRVTWVPSLVHWEFGFEAWIKGIAQEGCKLKLCLTYKNRVLAQDEYTIYSNEVHRDIALSDPGIDDFRNEILWSPEAPNLIDANVKLFLPSGELIDEVDTYTALRTVNIEGNRFILNGRPYYLRLALDQGYWEETGLTPPDGEALKKDIRLVKEMGFNGVRKHQKIEDPRFLYWADKLGLLVWEEMPSAYRFTKLAVERVTQEWIKIMERDISHPCIVAWVPFNESWGVPNLPDNTDQRHYVQALYHLTKTIDNTRLVVGNDGWESVATDIIGIHDYDSDPKRIIHRYHGDKLLPHILKQERPGGRLLVVGNNQMKDEHAIVLSEFGGIAYSSDKQTTWGYSRSDTQTDFLNNFTELMNAVHSLGILTGFCYTQLTDTYQEANGLLYINRQPKADVRQIRAAVRGQKL